jgi:tRNA(His) 5'-end guanylyltransferase
MNLDLTGIDLEEKCGKWRTDNMKDSLGDRIKEKYENVTRYYLPRRTHSIIRIDGKSFHSVTKNASKPFDYELMQVMQLTALGLCEEIQGCKLAYTQSDEISLLLIDYEKEDTEPWFGGNIQKMVSVAASMATYLFNEKLEVFPFLQDRLHLPALFDARVFTIADPIEVYNYFYWRQKDCERNSVSMAAFSYFPHKRLQGIGRNQMQELLFTEKGINWNDYPTVAKRGSCVKKFLKEYSVQYTRGGLTCSELVSKLKWEVDTEIPIFSQNKDYILGVL